MLTPQLASVPLLCTRRAGLQQRPRAMAWEHAVAAEAAHRPASALTSVAATIGEEEDEEAVSEAGYSSSEAGSYLSSPASSVSAGSTGAQSTHGSPTAALTGSGMQLATGSSRAAGGSSGSSWAQRRPTFLRSATTRGEGLTLRDSAAVASGREISAHLKAKRVQELVVALIQQFTDAYGPLILVLGAPLLPLALCTAWWLCLLPCAHGISPARS